MCVYTSYSESIYINGASGLGALRKPLCPMGGPGFRFDYFFKATKIRKTAPKASEKQRNLVPRSLKKRCM